ncbi:AAA family ATPase [Streptomyces sp. NPDC056188]|uniref:AAA family ATPase n=1 Tax=Streptomyces sp. NPDC056188 TaxID=3345740 RepID=UPI0035E354DA
MTDSLTEDAPEHKLVRVEVSQLLGRFDHQIPFSAEKDFVILHGPNGIGKTKLLELIDATFSINLQTISEIPFRSAEFTFSDGSVITIERTGQEALPGMGEDESLSEDLKFQLKQPGGRTIPWNASKALRRGEFSPGFLRLMESELPVRRLTATKWRDISYGDAVSARELYQRYSELLPRAGLVPHLDDMPDEISEALSSTTVHLIETQRLINLQAVRPSRSPRDPENLRQPTVVRFSEDFSRRLGEAMAQNSRVSQGLDRSFPRRLLSDTHLHPDITEDAIRARYSEQNEIRRRLTQISVLDATGELPLPDRSLADWERRVLWTYLDDTEDKLNTFKDLLNRVDLLREIVKSRFLYKELVLDRDGFHVVTSGGKEIPASKLSSGEQHELVLAYDLLFSVKPNSLVLIDEPEISLHVAWQKEFLNDIVRIAAINSARFMVATHSPQIIHKYWSETVGLEPGYANEEMWS